MTGTALLGLAVWKYAQAPWSTTTAVLVPLLGILGTLIFAMGVGWRGNRTIVAEHDRLEFMGQTITRSEILAVTVDRDVLKLVGHDEDRLTLVGLTTDEVNWLHTLLRTWHLDG